jgi:hypothetical protein
MTAKTITRSDLVSDATFAAERKERRAALLPLKRRRRVSLGPFCTFHFECFETMLFQIQEMLLIEKGGEAQIADELAAYNPLIPQGSELVATVMFEIEDERRRAVELARLGGVEDLFFLQVGPEKVPGVPEGDVERTRDDGKTSAVHFLRFTLTDDQKRAFNDPAVQVMVGCDHELYGHLAALSPAARHELSRDFT